MCNNKRRRRCWLTRSPRVPRKESRCVLRTYSGGWTRAVKSSSFSQDLHQGTLILLTEKTQNCLSRKLPERHAQQGTHAEERVSREGLLGVLQGRLGDRSWGTVSWPGVHGFSLITERIEEWVWNSHVIEFHLTWRQQPRSVTYHTNLNAQAATTIPESLDCPWQRYPSPDPIFWRWLIKHLYPQDRPVDDYECLEKWTLTHWSYRLRPFLHSGNFRSWNSPSNPYSVTQQRTSI